MDGGRRIIERNENNQFKWERNMYAGLTLSGIELVLGVQNRKYQIYFR